MHHLKSYPSRIKPAALTHVSAWRPSAPGEVLNVWEEGFTRKSALALVRRKARAAGWPAGSLVTVRIESGGVISNYTVKTASK